MTPSPAAGPAEGHAGATRREVWAWAMYDWANSAYSTLSITLLVIYIEKVLFPKEEYGTLGGLVWAWGIALSMFVAAVLSPIVGAMADAHANKRTWLAWMTFGGVGSSIALSLVPPEYPWVIVALFVSACLFFELSLGFYNGFLPEIADEQSMNRISAWGYGLGYVGGGLALLVALVVIKSEVTDSVTLLRGGLFIMGAWWGLFALPTLLVLRDRGTGSAAAESVSQVAVAALKKVGHTLGNIRSYRMLAIFLIAFLFYNDGVQTVLSQASTFAINVLDFSDEDLIGVILMIQFLALPGAILIGWLAGRLGQKPVLMFCLAVWIALLAYAYTIQEKWEFWLLGAFVALVMGGTQSVSRAIMGTMTPKARSAEFFGFFNLSGKATSFMGTFLFGAIIHQTGSGRYAIISLLPFFLIGLVLISKINIARGHRDALSANQTAED